MDRTQRLQSNETLIDGSDKDRQEAMSIWDKKEDNELEKLIEQLKQIPPKQLTAIFNGLKA